MVYLLTKDAELENCCRIFAMGFQTPQDRDDRNDEASYFTIWFSNQCTGYPKVPKQENSRKKRKIKRLLLNTIAIPTQ